MKLNLNFNAADIPDKVAPVDPGEYDCTVDSVVLADAKGERKQSYDFAFTVQEGPNKGRKLFDGFPPEFLVDPNGSAAVRLGHLIKSAGIKPTGSEIDFDEFVGKTVRLTVTHRTYTKDGVMQTAANVKDYIFKA
jgi:hypothetical protein